MRTGRPSVYSKELAADICGRLAGGEALSKICSEEGMPGLTTVYRWLQDKKDFRDLYARAREDQADTLADEVLKIADEPPEIVQDDRGVFMVDGAAIARQRLRIDARKWVASKLKPKKYGDRQEVAVEHSGVVAHQHRAVSETAEFLAEALGTGADRTPSESLPH